MRNPAAQQPRPDAAVRVGHETGPRAAAQLLPSCLLNNLAVDQMRQTVIIRCQPQTEPQAAAVVGCDRVRKPARHRRRRQ